MAEKEERICIKKVEICDNPKSDITHCSCLNHYQEEGLCWRHPDYNGLLPRSEAIERIAKAIYENIYIAGCETPTSNPLYDTADERTQYQYRDIAAHALDALLEK